MQARRLLCDPKALAKLALRQPVTVLEQAQHGLPSGLRNRLESIFDQEAASQVLTCSIV
jgi:hypothetical protein